VSRRRMTDRMIYVVVEFKWSGLSIENKPCAVLGGRNYAIHSSKRKGMSLRVDTM